MVRAKSVLLGRDWEVLNTLLEIHSESPTPVILDVTHNQGTMWKGTEFKPITMDIDPQYRTDLVADFRVIPVRDACVDVVVYDPPHLPTHAASKHSSRIWEKRYGITSDKGRGRDANNVVGQFQSFLKEAKRILKPGGIVLAKIADMVHNHRYEWQQVEFINAVRESGMTPCDMMIKIDPSAGNLMSSKWKNVKHHRKAHCYWIVVRKGNKCERRERMIYRGRCQTRMFL